MMRELGKTFAREVRFAVKRAAAATKRFSGQSPGGYGRVRMKAALAVSATTWMAMAWNGTWSSIEITSTASIDRIAAILADRLIAP